MDSFCLFLTKLVFSRFSCLSLFLRDSSMFCWWHKFIHSHCLYYPIVLLYHKVPICSTNEGYLHCFQLLAFMIKAAINILVIIFLGVQIGTSVEYRYRYTHTRNWWFITYAVCSVLKISKIVVPVSGSINEMRMTKSWRLLKLSDFYMEFTILFYLVFIHVWNFW